MKVTVAYGTPERQSEVTLELPVGACVADALEQARLQLPFDTLDMSDYLSGGPIGVFNQVVKPSQLLCEGDRVELYRPLVLDPMTARARRAESGH